MGSVGVDEARTGSENVDASCVEGFDADTPGSDPKNTREEGAVWCGTGVSGSNAGEELRVASSTTST